MKVKYQSQNSRLTLEAEGDVKEIFEQLALFDDVFNYEECPVTGSTNIAFRCREHDSNKYYEVYDRDSGYALHFGQTKQGNKLFPRYKDTKTGEWLPNKGWTKYDRNSD